MMKKETFYKISLTLVYTSILVACVGSDNNNPNVTPSPSPEVADIPSNPSIPNTPDTPNTPDIPSNPSIPKAPDTPNTPDTPDPNDNLSEDIDTYQFKDRDKVEDEGYIQGAQTYHKFNSNFEANTPEVGVYRGFRQRITEALHPSLDSIIIGWTEPSSIAQPRAIYLEDFDFTTNDYPVTMTAIYGVITPNSDSDLDLDFDTLPYSAGRHSIIGLSPIIPNALSMPVLHVWEDKTYPARMRFSGEIDTKTAYSGSKVALVAVYTQNQNNYTNTANYLPGGNYQENSKLIYDDAYVINHNRRDTIAEVYGHRTFVNSKRETMSDVKNLPLVGEKERVAAPGFPHIGYEGATLNHVQYGRVTSFLNKMEDGEALADPAHHTTGNFRVGKPSKNETRIASWGKFGINTNMYNNTPTAVVDGTNPTDSSQSTQRYYLGLQSMAWHDPNTKEDTYFYRGTGASTKTQIAALADQNIVAQYQGHAVTYGLDHNLHIGPSAPNAINDEKHFISGTHVYAKVDFAAKELTDGQLYNRWTNYLKKDAYNDVLVKFNGKLTGNAVYGDATKQYGDKDSGKFIGTFYGPTASELGGNIFSNETGEKSWGAVFGSVVQKEPYAGPGPNIKK